MRQTRYKRRAEGLRPGVQEGRSRIGPSPFCGSKAPEQLKLCCTASPPYTRALSSQHDLQPCPRQLWDCLTIIRRNNRKGTGGLLAFGYFACIPHKYSSQMDIFQPDLKHFLPLIHVLLYRQAWNQIISAWWGCVQTVGLIICVGAWAKENWHQLRGQALVFLGCEFYLVTYSMVLLSALCLLSFILLVLLTSCPRYLLVPYFLTSLSICVTTVFKKDCL